MPIEIDPADQVRHRAPSGRNSGSLAPRGSDRRSRYRRRSAPHLSRGRYRLALRRGVDSGSGFPVFTALRAKRPSRRGDRIGDVAYWPKADMTVRDSDVRFRG